MAEPPRVSPAVEVYRMEALKRLAEAAKLHSDAVVRIQSKEPGSYEESLAVKAILNAGDELDRQLHKACQQGASLEELISIPGLHPSYVEEIRHAAEHQPTTYVHPAREAAAGICDSTTWAPTI